MSGWRRARGTTAARRGIVLCALTTGARVADMAAAFPSSTFVGFDIHEPSIEARR